MLVERFIPGRELTVAVMGDRALAVTEIATDRGFYDYEAKYAPGGSPTRGAGAGRARRLRRGACAWRCSRTRRSAAAASRAPTCARTASGLYMLEVNTQPGMTPTSLVPEQAASVGISFPELVAWMVEHAEYDA